MCIHTLIYTIHTYQLYMHALTHVYVCKNACVHIYTCVSRCCVNVCVHIQSTLSNCHGRFFLKTTDEMSWRLNWDTHLNKHDLKLVTTRQILMNK